MAYFSEDFMQFLKDLAANNNRDWFHANKKRYESSVKQPFEHFVEEMIRQLQDSGTSIDIQPKDAIFRIYRDIRFSKDKTPYKTSASALISPKGRKDISAPGIYLELTPEHIRVYGGMYKPDKDQLMKIRKHIAKQHERFKKLIEDDDFVKYFSEIRGEKNKIIPKELKDAASHQPLIYNKQFYFFGELSPQEVTNPKLPELIMRFYHAGRPMMDFLHQAIG